MNQKIVALLGRKDEPTDAVEEYCRYLGEALRLHGFALQIARVPWVERGWPLALKDLWQQAEAWRGNWVFVQYTALAWSARGFPAKVLKVLNTLRRAGARIGVIFHDVEPYPGSRMVDRLRRSAQMRTMRRAVRLADLGVFTVFLENISWARNLPGKTVFIPVGANLPVPPTGAGVRTPRAGRALRISVFGITGGKSGRREAATIVKALNYASTKAGELELNAFGRHANDFAAELREGLRGTSVKVRVQGVLPPEQVAEELCSSDLLLFVRGQISSRRGSAIAGIACGLPVIAYQGPETAAPTTDAGVVLVSPKNPAELGEALTRVLTDDVYRESLAERSRAAQEKYFSWAAIARRYSEELRKLD
jgi:glycosyltransferase involved in cell wall biosynthesis